MQAHGPQARRSPCSSPRSRSHSLAAYVASTGARPRRSPTRLLDGEGDVANGAELFRINCAMCHNVAGAGGALTEGKFAPPLTGVTAAAHLRGHGHRPAEHAGLQRHEPLPRRQARHHLARSSSWRTTPPRADSALGSLGPVAEGLFLWIFGLGAIVALTVWITARVELGTGQ